MEHEATIKFYEDGFTCLCSMDVAYNSTYNPKLAAPATGHSHSAVPLVSSENISIINVVNVGISTFSGCMFL